MHPKYLDSQGLVALWREALLARAVLRGQTRGYRHHPQLERFRAQPAPVAAIGAYLYAVYTEAVSRGYAFDRDKIGTLRRPTTIPVTVGQIAYEWQHLLRKLAARSPALYARWRTGVQPECHPLFRLRSGALETWERP